MSKICLELNSELEQAIDHNPYEQKKEMFYCVSSKEYSFNLL
jgi:hypothetical protein